MRTFEGDRFRRARAQECSGVRFRWPRCSDHSNAGQDILARNFYRVHSPAVAQRYKSQFPDVQLVTIEVNFGGWDKVVKTHCADGGILDQALATK